MRVTVDNIRSLRSGMKHLEEEYDILIGPLENLRNSAMSGLGAFGYWTEYYVPENDKVSDLIQHLDRVMDYWHGIEKYVEQWYSYQNDSRDWWVNEQITKARNFFEPKLDELERLLRELVELGGESVDKPGN